MGAEEDKSLVEMSKLCMVKDKMTGELKKRERAKPLWMIKRDQEVLRLMVILKDPEIVLHKVKEMEFMKGKSLSVRRIYQIVSEYRDQAIEKMIAPNVPELVAEAKDRYELLIREAMSMIAESYAVRDPEAKLKAKALALDKARQTQQALDQLLKAAGIYREQLDINQNINVNIRETKEWLKLEEAIMLFLRYGLHQQHNLSIDPLEFLEFIEKCENDPVYLQKLKDRVEKDTKGAVKDFETGALMDELYSKKDPESIMTADYKEIGGEDGEYTEDEQTDLKPESTTTEDEQDGTGQGEVAADSENV